MSGEGAPPDGPALARCHHCGEDHPPHLLKCPETDLPLPLEGRILHGKFRFIRQLGKGGMASVWLAVNTLVERRVAIKLIRPEVGRSEDTVARFRAEAKAAGRIGHPAVCEIIDFGLGPLGPYIVMERLRGQSLGELIRREERLDPALAVGIVRQALAGLDAAHRRGIIHRDLKPENLFVHQPEGGTPIVKIMDFGVSKFMDGSGEVQTAHGALLGTPEYMSPEQFKGAARADVRTDIWAMGAILYKALTGKTAFGGPSVAATLLIVTTEDPKPITEMVRGVPPDLITVVMRCLNKDPDARYQSVEALSEELEPFDLDTLDALPLEVPDDDEEEAPSAPTMMLEGSGVISVSGASSITDDAPASDPEGPRPESQAQIATLHPTTQARILLPDAHRPRRPDRRAFAVIGAVTLLGCAALYWLTQRSPPADATPTPTVSARPPAGEPTHERADPASDTTGDPTSDLAGPAGTIGASTTTAGASPTTAGASPTTAGATTSQGSTAGALTTSGPQTGGSDSGGPAATGTTGSAPVAATTLPPTEPRPSSGDTNRPKPSSAPTRDAPSTPPPAPVTPPGTVRAGAYLAVQKRGPISNHAQAKAYCRDLGAQAFAGISDWHLANPTLARKMAGRVKRGKYWTSALWRGKATVIVLPAKESESRVAKKSGPRALCVTKAP